MKTNSILVVLIVGISLVDAVCGQTNPPPEKSKRTILRVAMFPYLPALGAKGELSKRIEKEFEKRHPDVDLKLTLDPWLDYYDPYVVAGWLRSEHSDGKKKDPFDLVEIDAVLLGTLVDMEAVSEWPYGATDLIKTGYEAACLDGRQYGVPHWLCGHFIITEDQTVAKSKSIGELIAALEAANTPRPNLVGNLLGSWNTAALYIDAWVDSRSNPDPLDAIRIPLDVDIIKDLTAFAAQGVDGKSNPCIDGTFDNWKKPNLAATRFGKGKADALFGYSERTHYAQIAGVDPKNLFVRSAPLGRGSDPVWFVDIWVTPNYDKKSVPKPVQKSRKDAARRFVEYINSPATFEWIHFNKDAAPGKAAPRYLIPATISAFKSTPIGRDPIMSQIWQVLDEGTFFPQRKLPGLRRSMGAQIEGAWNQKSK